jgi:hypothetical protein
MLANDFVEKLVLSIIDKVALGGVVLVLGYFINRRLEGIKSREAVRKALLERRMTAILEQWDALRNFHFDTVDAWIERVPTADDESVPLAAAEASPTLNGAVDARGLLRACLRIYPNGPWTITMQAHETTSLSDGPDRFRVGADQAAAPVCGTQAQAQPARGGQRPVLPGAWWRRLADAPPRFPAVGNGVRLLQPVEQAGRAAARS